MLLGLVAFISVLEFGLWFAALPLGVDGVAGFMSELLELLGLTGDDGEVVDDGEVALVEPVWLEEVDGVLCELLAPLPAPLPSLLPAAVPLPLLCATAIPVEKMTAVAIVRSFLFMMISPGRWLASFGNQMARTRQGLPRNRKLHKRSEAGNGSGSDMYSSACDAAVHVNQITDALVNAARDNHSRYQVKAMAIGPVIDDSIGQDLGQTRHPQ